MAKKKGANADQGRKEARETHKAVAYLRTSNEANVGADNDSDNRQRRAIWAYANAAGLVIVSEFYDADDTGADIITDRPGFAAMLERLVANGPRTIIVETPDLFARNPAVQFVGHGFLEAHGITLIAASAPTHFNQDSATARLVRQVLPVVAQFDKAISVAKLAAARKRLRVERKRIAEVHPEAVEFARKLAAARKGKPSLLTISAALAAAGYVNERGVAFNRASVAQMLEYRDDWGYS